MTTSAVTMDDRQAPEYRLLGSAGFVADLARLESQVAADPKGAGAALYRNLLREIRDLAAGRSDGHHVLGFSEGKGDLRDCVASKLQSDPQQKADHRLTFREIPALNAGGVLDGRELLAVQPRQGAATIYDQTSARLGRDLHSHRPELDRFGDRPAGSGGNEAQRRAERDTRRAIAHAWSGQKPLATSRPLDPAHFGGSTGAQRKLHLPDHARER